MKDGDVKDQCFEFFILIVPRWHLDGSYDYILIVQDAPPSHPQRHFVSLPDLICISVFTAALTTFI